MLSKEFDEALSKVGEQTFLVRVLFRQSATLQGEIVWLQMEKTQYFRSVIELLVLIQEALDEAGTPAAEYTFRSWKHDEEEEVVS